MEYVEETQLEQEINVMQCMLDYYNKELAMFSNDTMSHIFQESKQESTFEKVILFIPKMIAKLINFIKTKLKKLFNKDIPNAVNNVRGLIDDHKKNKNKSKIAITAAAIGCTVTAGVSGFILYNKQKHKVIEIISSDDSDEVEIIIPFDLEKVSKLLEESSKLSETYYDYLHGGHDGGKSGYKKTKEQLSVLTKELKEFNASLSSNTKQRKMTIQQLQQTLQHLLDDNKNANDKIVYSKNESPIIINTDKNNADQLKQAFTDFSNEFGKFSANIMNEINVIHQTLLILINGTEETVFIPFEYVDKIITYCSYRSSPTGFRWGVINNPSSTNKPSPDYTIQSSSKAFDSKGNLAYAIIKHLLEDNLFIKPAWGIINGTKFIATPSIIIGNFDKYQNYTIIFKSTADEQFRRFISFINTTSVETLKVLTKDIMVTNYNNDNSDGGYQGFKMHPFSKFMAASQKSSAGVSKDLIPNDNEIMCHANRYDEEQIKDTFNHNHSSFSDRNVSVTRIKGLSDMIKISLDKGK